jgi:hypothetical protein
MSADNWGKCPNCLREESLREDYSLGMYSGKFEVDYHAECLTGHDEGCGYRFAYKIVIDPHAVGYVQPSRITEQPAPQPTPEQVRETLRQHALERMTPEERAAFETQP